MPQAATRPIRRRRFFSATLFACVALLSVVLSGCGTGTGTRAPSVKRLPLVHGLHVISQQRVCDKGSNAYCAIEMVLSAPGYPNSHALQKAERLLLKKRGWARVNAPVGQELAADSPGGRLRVTYAAANLELEAIDLGWIQRSRPITLALSRQIFSHGSALAVLLQVGTT